MGQGARTIFAQIAAQELGAPIDWVTVVMGDTAVVPVRPADVGEPVVRAHGQRGPRTPAATSRPSSGRWPRGSRRSTRPRSSVDRGEVRIGERVLPIRDVLIRGLGRLGGEVIGIGEMRKEAEPDHPLGGTAAFFEFNCTAVEVEVDRETGDIVVARHVTVSDVGKALNPIQVRGQDEGAAVMGLGHTLMEQLIYDDDGPDPEPRRDRLPDPDEHGPAAPHGERHHRARGRPRAVRRRRG